MGDAGEAMGTLRAVRDLVTDLQLVEGTRGLISLFSARQAPAPGKLPAALFPKELPEGADYDMRPASVWAFAGAVAQADVA